MSGSVRQYFDPRLLAQFICQSSCFRNPLSGVALTRMDCRRLDAHLREQLDPPCDEWRVVELFDLYHASQGKDSGSSSTGSSSTGQSESQQRSAALAMLNLFDFSGGRAATLRAPRRGGGRSRGGSLVV